MSGLFGGTPLVLVTEGESAALAGTALGPEDREALAAIKLEKRRSEWTLGRLAAKLALAWVLVERGAPPDLADLVIRPGADGAPEAFLRSGADLVRLEVGLSLTHGHGLGAAWALPGGLPGIDLERVRPRPEGTFRFYLDPREREPLLALAGEERDAGAVVLWALKEAVWKTLRPHRGVGIIDFEIFAPDLRASQGSARVELRGAAVELARTRGVSRIEAQYRREGDMVAAWARGLVG